jgi:hypothetical protein
MHNYFTFIITIVIVVITATVTTSLAVVITINSNASTVVASTVVTKTVIEFNKEGLHLTADHQYGVLKYSLDSHRGSEFSFCQCKR